MHEYIIRLCNQGMSLDQAYSILFIMIKENGYDGLERYLAELEEHHVDTV